MYLLRQSRELSGSRTQKARGSGLQDQLEPGVQTMSSKHPLSPSSALLSSVNRFSFLYGNISFAVW